MTSIFPLSENTLSCRGSLKASSGTNLIVLSHPFVATSIKSTPFAIRADPPGFTRGPVYIEMVSFVDVWIQSKRRADGESFDLSVDLKGLDPALRLIETGKSLDCIRLCIILLGGLPLTFSSLLAVIFFLTGVMQFARFSIDFLTSSCALDGSRRRSDLGDGFVMSKSSSASGLSNRRGPTRHLARSES